MEDIKVSVITVCYNSENTIRRTIESVLKQTYSNIEYIIVDGASVDSTLDIVKEYEESFGGRLRFISEPDGGIYFAMNKGISMATGELIGMINSDDWYEPDAVKVMAEAYSEQLSVSGGKPYQILYGKTRSVRDGEEVSISESDHTRLREEMISHPSSFVSAALYRELGAYDTKFISAADYDFMLRMYAKDDVVFTRVDELIANFTLGGMCASSKAYYDLLKVRKRHGIISGLEYLITVCKCRIYDTLHGAV
ncbi:MAG: glycosyltransferase [Lachnospiraceae bacterium]|nr:glycosyltransferase [Candidatus Colinaster equi]